MLSRGGLPARQGDRALFGANMWLLVVCQVLAVRAMVVPDRRLGQATEMGCIEYSTVNHERFGRMINEGWRSQNPVIRRILAKPLSAMPDEVVVHMSPMSRRVDSILDNIIPGSDHLLKEHAKLVQDINGLRQVVFITPFRDENKDYDDSIFQEIIETSTTTRPTSIRTYMSTTRPALTSTKGSSFPIILLGGASQRQVVKSQPINFMKPTVSLVGTTVSPLVQHPYPFVSQRKPVKICMNSLPTMFPPPTTRRPPTLWERLIDYFLPNRNFNNLALGR